MSLKRYRKEESEESDIEDEVKDYVPYISIKDRKRQALMKHKVIAISKEEPNKNNDTETNENEKPQENEDKSRAPISLLDQHHELKEQAEQVKETELEKQIKEEQKILESIAERKALMAATELAKGTVEPGLEVDIVIEHPLFNQHPNDTYRDLFIAGRADALPNNLTSLQVAELTSSTLSTSFHQIAAERKAYAAIAFQYLAEDLMLKATEMNEVIKQSGKFSMTEAERIRLQTFAGDYLLRAGQLLERSDKLLLDVASVRPLQQQADQEQKRLERMTIAQTPILNN